MQQCWRCKRRDPSTGPTHGLFKCPVCEAAGAQLCLICVQWHISEDKPHPIQQPSAAKDLHERHP